MCVSMNVYERASVHERMYDPRCLHTSLTKSGVTIGVNPLDVIFATAHCDNAISSSAPPCTPATTDDPQAASTAKTVATTADSKTNKGIFITTRQTQEKQHIG